MADYYDWGRTLTYDADITIVISSRGLGKTYGLRKQCIADYRKNGYRFVAVSRTKTEMRATCAGYFDRVGSEWPDSVFKVEHNAAYRAPKPKEGKRPKREDWQLIGYFVAMTELQQIKQRTFDRVKRILMDEAVLERIDRYHHYLPYEWEALASIVDSCTRERADDTDRIRPKVYLLGNACDLVNPWFRALGIDRAPEFGYSWHANKTCLLHYVEPSDYERVKSVGTLAGRMLDLTGSGDTSIRNSFSNANLDFVFKKTKRSKFLFGITYANDRYGIWEDKTDGYLYITSDIPNNARPVFALTARDGRANMIVAQRAEPSMRFLVNCYYRGLVLYESPYVRERLLDALSLFGVR